MVVSYILILCVSAMLAAWAALRISRRLEVMLGSAPVPTGAFAVLSAIGFLIIVAIPSVIAMAALLLVLLGGLTMRENIPAIAQFGLPLIAVLLGLSALHVPAIGGMQPWVLYLGSGAVWLLVTLGGQSLPDEARMGSLGLTLMLLPLAVAPLLGPTPDYLALDVALLIAALTGAVTAHRNAGSLGLICRLPYGFLFGWLLLVALLHQAYLPVAASCGIWLVVVLRGLMQKPYASLHAHRH